MRGAAQLGRPSGPNAEERLALEKNVPVRFYLDFEKPIAELEAKITELKQMSSEEGGVSISTEIETLEDKVNELLVEMYSKLTPWEKTLVARHPERPHCLDYIDALIDDFTPLAGDRYFGEDAAIVGGIGTFRGRSVMVIGNEKGSDTQSRIKHNFGMASPEGYRKAVRLMEMADKFNMPIITLVDTAGAYPGVAAEERGQAEAIARSTDCCLKVRVPIISVIIGEGGSGGAVAIATANTILMLEHAIYSVISPEGAASIIWRDSDKKTEAATSMKITAQDLIGLSVIDEIIEEPVGGAHRDRRRITRVTGNAIAKALDSLGGLDPDELRQHRYDRFLKIGRELPA
ncbi:MAG: acetyl-CoA carboxylase carboxyltransferase subunit alpha [Hyphomicrobiaceae bacterium]|nr:acetyl-CoA carboxylase carboxyltransferase subunit alpha [Hyphomicrobiaceae bacterium]MCC0009134.1 acetyl-CoA carboxylase carboxyltransferase subunit alpha [Hyphomicrobiaceae bacterium]